MNDAKEEVAPPKTAEDLRFLSVHEVSKLLHVSRGKLYGLISRRQDPLPSVRVGKSRRFPFDRVQAWMARLNK